MLRTVGNEFYHNTYYKETKVTADLINVNTYLGWPNMGMAEWTNGCERGPGGHFLDEGHQRVANKINEHIRNLGWLS